MMIATKIGQATYSVASERIEGTAYIVDLEFKSCSCPDFQHRRAGTNRGPCKHIVTCQAQAPRIELLEKARRCSDAQLAGLLEKYGAVSPEIGGALRVVRQERRQEDLLQADHQAHMRSVFA